MAFPPENPSGLGAPRPLPPEPPRFVPTLTDVVHVAPATAAPVPAAPVCASVAIDTDALAARVCDAVLRGLDAQLRQAVSDVLQTEHRRLMQELQIHLLPLVENRVRDALATEVAGRSQGSQKLLSGN